MDKKQWLQKIPPEWGYYLAGFADGEGSFIVSLRRRKDHTMGWQVSLTFNVAQREEYILTQFKRYLKCGRLQKRKDGVYYYVCSNPKALYEQVIPFFNKYGFRSQRKKNNFRVFKDIVSLVYNKKHLTESGLKEIIGLREKLNVGAGRTRKYNMQDYLKDNPQRLYAKPRAFRKEKHDG